MVLQNTSAGSTFLRWRTRDFARMGVAVWERQVGNQALPQVVREGLHRFECERIALNLQMSVVHSLYRQASTCASGPFDATASFDAGSTVEATARVVDAGGTDDDRAVESALRPRRLGQTDMPRRAGCTTTPTLRSNPS